MSGIMALCSGGIRGEYFTSKSREKQIQRAIQEKKKKTRLQGEPEEETSFSESKEQIPKRRGGGACLLKMNQCRKLGYMGVELVSVGSQLPGQLIWQLRQQQRLFIVKSGSRKTIIPG